ncbi:MAG: hypothetical protein PHI98_14830 [Eubacteriales bacterium]|nr:hypothetical protein [Eubacteriales bacterium]
MLRLKTGIMRTDELEQLIELLHIENPWETLFKRNEKSDQTAV